jgi:hypothetical protein
MAGINFFNFLATSISFPRGAFVFGAAVGAGQRMLAIASYNYLIN